MIKRPPIIAIMGHVDHGKTTLLDFIRKTNVAGKEAGGITQSIGAYEIIHNSQPITFIDTPGHEAFSCMREHGAKIADIAILVIAADDGVKPQTKDAIKCITETKTPFIVAINKIDKPGANIEKTKNDLMQINIFLEGSGGTISWHAISAKTGEGVNELLDLILLASEMENLTYNPEENAEGVVLTSRLDGRRGNAVGIILKNGVLKKGQFIKTQTANGKIKILEDYSGKQINEIKPSAPALIIGFETLPKVGEEFQTNDAPMLKSTEITQKTQKEKLTASHKDSIRTVLKADESGSLEALKGVIQRISKDFPLYIIEASVGNITENDVKTAESGNAIIASFKSKMDKAAENLAKAKKVKVISSNIIYELEKEVQEHFKKITRRDVRTVEILAIFGGRKGKLQVVGGKATKGTIKNQEPFEIWSDDKQIGIGKIVNLQSKRKDVPLIEEGQEFGMFVESDEPIAVGNKLIFINES